MRISLALGFLAPIALLTAARPVLAQETLSLNGAATATLPPGGILVVTATLPPGTPALIAYDVTPGPTPIFGEMVPLGFTAALNAVGGAGIVPESGIFVSTVVVPDLPFLVGSDFYLCGLAIDPNDPNGIAFTTGAALSIRIESNAGARRAGFTGETIVLDGGANASSAGALAAGDSVSWQIVSAPVGSLALLAGSTTLYPTITPDVAGEYVVEATLSKNGVPLAPKTTKVTAFQASGFSLSDNLITDFATNTLHGILAPIGFIAQVTVNGVPCGIGTDGSFTMPSLPWNAGQVSLPIEVEVMSTSGEFASQMFTILKGLPGVTATAVDNATQLRITKETFTQIANFVPIGLTQSMFSAMVNLPPSDFVIDFPFPVPDATFTVDPTGGSYTSMTVTSLPNNTDILFTATVTNAKVNFNFSGTVLLIPFSTTGSATATVTQKVHVVFSAPTTGPNKGLLLFNVTAENPVVSGMVVNLGSIPSQITSFASGVVTNIFNSLAQGALKNKINELVNAQLNGFNLDLNDLAVDLGAQYSQSLAFTAVVHSADGVTATAKTDLVPDLPPTGPTLPEFVSGDGPLGAFGPTIPDIGGTYNWGTAITVDGLNALLAKFTMGGIANISMEELAAQLGLTFGAFPFTAAELAALLPSAGFERLPAGHPVTLRFEATVAPIVKGDPTNPYLWLEFPGVKAKFLTKAPGSAFEVEFLELKLSANAKMKEEMEGPKLKPIIEEKQEKANAKKGMPSLKKPAAIETGKKFAESLAALVEKALKQISLPGYKNPGGFTSKPAEKVGPIGGKAAVGAWVKFQ